MGPAFYISVFEISLLVRLLYVLLNGLQGARALPLAWAPLFDSNKAPRAEAATLLQVSRRQPLRIECARVGGVEIPNQKRIEYSLQYIYGVGHTTAKAILVETVSCWVNPSWPIYAMALLLPQVPLHESSRAGVVTLLCMWPSVARDLTRPYAGRGKQAN